MNTMRIFFFSGLLLGVLLSLAAGCGNRQTAAVLDDVETYIQDRPDSALTALRAIDTTTLNSRRLHAQYALLLSMALDKNWIDTTDVNVVMPAVAYYDRHRPVSRRAKPYYYLGRIQYNGGHYDEAILSFTQAREYATGVENDRFKAMVFHAMGDTYNMSYLFEEAYAMSDSSYLYCLKTGDTVLINIALFQVAQNLNNLKRYRDAVSIYDTLVNDPSVQTNHNLFGRVLSGYALAVINDTQDYEKARKLYERCLANGGRFDNLTHWGAYAYSLANVGEIDKAKRIFNQLEGRYGEQYAYQAWKSRMERLQGNLPEAYALLVSSSERQTDRTREILSQSVVKAQRDYFGIQTRLLQEKEARRKTIEWLVACLFLMLFALIRMLYQRQVETMREEKEVLLRTIKELSDNLSEVKASSKKQEEHFFSRYVQLFHTHFQQMGMIHDMLRNSQTEEGTDQLIRALRNMLRKQSMSRSKQQAFETMLNQELSDVMSLYRKEYPGQKEEDYRLVSFFFAGFDVPTICTLVGNKTKQAIYSKKSKLKQKIAKGSSPHKKQFIETMG